MFAQVLATSYLILLGVLACYGVYRYYLVWLYYRVKDHRSYPSGPMTVWPRVTIQIPVYNERYVVERAIQSACDVDYPHERLDIQILDDSTDDTSELIAAAVVMYRRQGLQIAHLRRAARTGFKAGALAEGLRQAYGELVAVFDVDFLVPATFLRETVPFFVDPSIGMVQARWGHLNAEYSLLTQGQAIFLDGHFAIEQVARHQAGRFFSFNGTGGVWRKAAIESAGGWQTDTLTEDLDLSYRAQLCGWRCVFLPDVVAPAELPVEMNAFKTQQHRWTKGSVQTTKKLLPMILRSRVPWRTKLHACLHLGSFFVYPIGLLASLGVPLMLLGVFRLPHAWYSDDFWWFFLVVPGYWFYLCSQRELYPKWGSRLLLVPWTVALGIGLSWHNTRAVLEGLFGHTSTFIRTPKFHIENKADQWQQKTYRAPRTISGLAELVLAGYFLAGVIVALERRCLAAVPCLLVFVMGFAYVGGLSLWQDRGLPAWWTPPEPLRELQA